MNSADIRRKFIAYYVRRDHKELPSAPLVPENDPTTLFTSSGMQPLVPYILGQPHPLGNRLVNSQKAFRAQDIEEVGDNRHTTFFEMLGNWSLGDYFKKEQLPWIWEFLTQELELPKEKLYVSVFEGNESVPKDEESVGIWKSFGVPEDHMFYYGVKNNWWSRSGEPEKMPFGEPGGPDSEVFFDFGPSASSRQTHQCHPNCDCGRFMEIANSVFMQYRKNDRGDLEELKQKNVDFGGGLERMTAATSDEPDVFRTDLFLPVICEIERLSGYSYGKDAYVTRSMRIIADHIKGAVMMMADSVMPSNKTQGYILRRLIRRSLLYGGRLGLKDDLSYITALVDPIADMYRESYPDVGKQADTIRTFLTQEAQRFSASLSRGLSEFEKMQTMDGKVAFRLYETYGFPWEMTAEIAAEKGMRVNREQFEEEFRKHQEVSRTAAAGMFKGGLADHGEQTKKLHTVHHLLLASLQKVIDPNIKQRGSNITADRLRIDINFPRKLTGKELQDIETSVNMAIAANYKVMRVEMSKSIAEAIGAQREFGTKYPDKVSVYFVGLHDNIHPEDAQPGDYFSAEFCGGPHADFTGELGHFTIRKEESAGSGIRRLYGNLSA